MKKILVLMLVGLFLFSLTACGGNEGKNDINSSEPAAQVENDTNVISSENESVSNEETSKWKQFIKEYDEWVDEYISLLNKYKDNPTDASILSDYTEMANDLAEWSTKADEVTEELKNSPEEAAEYAKELAKIATKLADAAK